MAKEYIELGAAIAKIREEGVYGEGHSSEERENDVISMLESIPAADVVEVVHGQWVGSAFDFYCSACGAYQGFHVGRTKYCPNCGTRMDGE